MMSIQVKKEMETLINSFNSSNKRYRHTSARIDVNGGNRLKNRNDKERRTQSS
jgi:hypothetical protein